LEDQRIYFSACLPTLHPLAQTPKEERQILDEALKVLVKPFIDKD
jgi:hypothetical protein